MPSYIDKFGTVFSYRFQNCWGGRILYYRVHIITFYASNTLFKRNNKYPIGGSVKLAVSYEWYNCMDVFLS